MAKSKRVHLTSGKDVDPISEPYDDRYELERLDLDLTPEEVAIAMRYYGSIAEYLRCEKDNPIY